MVMGINFPDLTMVPGSVEPMVRQSYKDRIDESWGMRRGPEREFKQTLADRRDESMGASLGRYGEPGLPSLVKTPSPQPMGSPSTQGAYASPESQAGYKADLLAYAAANNIRRDDSDPNQVNADAMIASMGEDPSKVSDGIKNIFTKDYRALMKAVDKKQGKALWD